MGYAINPEIEKLKEQSDNCQATFFHRYITSQSNVELLRSIYNKLEKHFKYTNLMSEDGKFDEFKMMEAMQSRKNMHPANAS